MSDDKPPSTGDPGSSSWWQKLQTRFSARPRDRDDLVELLSFAHQRGLLDRQAERMMRGVLEVFETQVREVMIPRPHIVVLERDASPEELLHTIVESGHSRFPVIGDNRDEIVGILLAKDLLRVFADGESARFDIKECLRPAVFVPESKRLDALLQEFRNSHNHMAVVVDEYGGVAGLATIEDVIEQIVGDIDDEHDVEDDVAIQKEQNSVFTVRALTRIDEFNEYFGANIPDEDFDTVGGLIMHNLGHLPRRGEILEVDNIRFKVTRADRRRIETVQVRLLDGKELPVSANVA
ncbi:MAG: CBS domain-containing protein [Gammaproteobacteria bacterium]|nr:CBS domain-containing protein [Gammaproteobacteria bacterium]